MDYSFGIEQFKSLIEEIELAKKDGMLDITGHDVEILHNKCQVMIKNIYQPSSEWGEIPFMHELILLKDNNEGYNGYNRLSRLRNMVDVMILDLKMKAAKSEKQVNISAQAYKSLELELQNYQANEAKHKQTIDELEKRLKEHTTLVELFESRKDDQSVMESLASYENILNRLKRYLWIVSFATVTSINLAIPFVLQKFNWFATGTVQASIIGIFLWMYYRPKIAISSSVKQNVIAFFLGILGTVIGGYILYKMGWNG